jgi:RNA 2',3'-cyclic 3'-phosphodiesterase
MRCFIAIDMDPAIKTGLARLQKQISGRLDLRRGDVTWVRDAAMHLTLKFLGDVPDAHLMDVCRITEQVSRRHGRFDLAVEGVGHFGGASARVLWVGTGTGTEELLALQKDLEDQLEEAGWPREGRGFSSHLTLCRVKNPKAGSTLVAAIKAVQDVRLGTTGVDSIVVYESQLHPEGPVYLPLGRYTLGEQTG